MISTRQFLARPPAVVLPAMGLLSPQSLQGDLTWILGEASLGDRLCAASAAWTHPSEVWLYG